MKVFTFSMFVLLISLIVLSETTAATVLTPGDIVIVSINGDNDTNTAFGGPYGRGYSFMPLVNLEEGTEIFFTDYGWSDVNSAFITNTGIADQFLKYTVPSGGINAGTIIRNDSYDTTDFSFVYSYSGTNVAAAGKWLNTAGLSAGDELLIFQADYNSTTHVFSSISFIFAASIVSTTKVANSWATNVGADGTDGSGSGSALPPGLTDDVNALSFNQPAAANDNCSYSGVTTATDKSGWQTRIKNYANWTFNDTPPIPTPYVGPFTVTGISVSPSLTTQIVTSVTTSSAVGNGNITALGSANPTAHGFCWGTTANPTVSGNKVDLGASSSTGTFSGSITGLAPGTQYFVRAFATNTAGTSYGVNAAFTTPNAHPMVLTNGRNANFVIGQPDFSSNNANTPSNALGLNGPYPMAIDEVHGKLYVADNSNNRVLRYLWPINSNEPTPELVFGQTSINSIETPSTETGIASACYMPNGLAVDAYGNLWVACLGYNRVIRFPAAYAASADNPSADKVLGQINFTDIGSVIEAAQNTLHQPAGICFDGLGNLWVAEANGYRVVCFYDANSKSNGANADKVFGFSDFVSITPSPTTIANGFKNVTGVVAVGTSIYVTDADNNRILRFDNALNKANGASADCVFGQADMTSGLSACTDKGFNFPASLSANASGDLLVNDPNNNRVMVFLNANAKGNNPSADYVIGQSGFTTSESGTSQSSFYDPYYSAYDTKNNLIVVSEYSNNRVMVFGPAPTVQASGITFSNVSGTQMDIAFTPGDGAYRAVFVKSGSGAITNPVDAVTYTASANFASPGSQLGTSGYYCVYKGSGSGVTITGLSSGTQYTVQVFEFNGSAGNEYYNTSTATDNPKSQTTATRMLSATALTDFGTVCTGWAEGSHTFTLSGTNMLPNDIVINPLDGYLYSTSLNGQYYTTLDLGSLTGDFSMTIYVVFEPTAAQSYDGNIVVSGGGAASINVPVTGTGILAPIITISGAAQADQGSTQYTYTTESGKSAYDWSVSSGGTIISSSGNTATVVWNQPGTQYVFVNYENSNGCSASVYQDKSVTVKPNTVYVSADNNSGTSEWGLTRFNDLATALASASTRAIVHVSNYTYTGTVDADANTYIIDAGDFQVNGTITATTGRITAISTGYLSMQPAQNAVKTYPLTDGTNDYTVTVTCANAPTQPVKIKINKNKAVAGKESVDFWDISGESNLNATLVFRIPNSMLKAGRWLNSDQFRFYNGSRYLPIPSDRITITNFTNYAEVTVSGLNTF